MAYLKTLVDDGRTEQRIARRARVLLAMTKRDRKGAAMVHLISYDLQDRETSESHEAIKHLERNNGACLRAVLPQLLGDHRDAKRIHLI